MGRVLDLDPDRLRDLFARGLTVADVCRAVGAAHGTVSYWRRQLGFAPTRRRKIDPDRLRELHAARLGDAEIAARLGCHPTAVKQARRRLKLAAWGKALPSFRAKLAATYRERTAAAGVKSLRSLAPDAHLAARRRLAEAYGLPGDLHAVQVALAAALAGGPRTARELADACGRKPTAGNPYHRFNCPTCGRAKNHLSDLVARGLVVRRPGLRGAGGGSGRGESVYLLTPAAMDMLAAVAKERA